MSTSHTEQGHRSGTAARRERAKQLAGRQSFSWVPNSIPTARRPQPRDVEQVANHELPRRGEAITDTINHVVGGTALTLLGARFRLVEGQGFESAVTQSIRTAHPTMLLTEASDEGKRLLALERTALEMILDQPLGGPVDAQKGTDA